MHIIKNGKYEFSSLQCTMTSWTLPGFRMTQLKLQEGGEIGTRDQTDILMSPEEALLLTAYNCPFYSERDANASRPVVLLRSLSYQASIA